MPSIHYSLWCNYSANKTLLDQNLYTTLCFATHRKAILQTWLFLANFLNCSFSLALLLLELLASDSCISLIIAFRTSAFQEKKLKRFHSIFTVHIWMHMSHCNMLFWKITTLSTQTYIFFCLKAAQINSDPSIHIA